MTIGKLPSEAAELAENARATKGKWGLQLQDLTPQIGHQFGLQAQTGVVVVGIEPQSPADEAGLRQGDLIVEVNRKPVKSVDDIKEKISKSKDKDNLLLLVQRDKGKLYVALEQQG